MRLELAEKLICPSAHDATPLVVVAQETVERDLQRAQLGCMLCHRKGDIRDGSVSLGSKGAARREGQAQITTDDAVTRLAALLALDEPGALVLLGAAYAAQAPALYIRYDALTAVYDVAGASPANVGYLQVTEDCVPFTSGSFTAAALDSSMSPLTIADALRTLRVGGRVVGDAHLALPRGVRELARDRDGWVGELEAAASPVIPLRRA